MSVGSLPFFMGWARLKGENAQLEDAWLQEQGFYVIKTLGESRLAVEVPVDVVT